MNGLAECLIRCAIQSVNIYKYVYIHLSFSLPGRRLKYNLNILTLHHKYFTTGFLRM